MLALEPVIVERLRGALPAGWSVKGHTADGGDRKVSGGPLAVVMFGDGQVSTSRVTAAMVQPGWMLTLVTRRGEGAAQEIDGAFTASISALHNWMPGEVAGRPWEPLNLVRVAAPAYVDDGLVGLELTFITSGLYHGQS